ncbi:MAG: acyloxyacyl hydrolase [Terracidiphilus sp.]|nr:acyloxyacyl hydrolase [Terracidiphilus sp.]MDR3796553.1 acyloxyacyl hydrolase [Terracidiphilus sp.]
MRWDMCEVRRVLIAAAMMGAMSAIAQTGNYSVPISAGSGEKTMMVAGAPASDDSVGQVRNQRGWEYGPFINWGTGVGDRSDFKFLSAGFELGKVLTPVVHAGILSGQLQLAGNIMPLWQAYTPAPHLQVETCVDPVTHLTYSCTLPYGGGTFYGVSLTPVIFRWNFATSSHRIQPWFQAAGGLIYTTHKFPPNFLTNKAAGINGGTSVWNFSPQGGGGIHYFLSPKRSIDLGVNGVHISSASLGDRNPGVNASIQIQVGYTFWK